MTGFELGRVQSGLQKQFKGRLPANRLALGIDSAAFFMNNFADPFREWLFRLSRVESGQTSSEPTGVPAR